LAIVVHGDHAGHGLAASNTFECMSSHCRHVVREQNPIFLGCPSQNFSVRASAVTSLSDAQNIQVRKRPP